MTLNHLVVREKKIITYSLIKSMQHVIEDTDVNVIKVLTRLRYLYYNTKAAEQGQIKFILAYVQIASLKLHT